MRIVHIASEFAPIAKAGGLGEVLVGLTREQIQAGAKVDVILPRYDTIDLKSLQDLKMELPDFKSFEGGFSHANTMWSALYSNCRLHLLEARHPSGYFHRGKIYGCPDDALRFLYFSRAAMEYLFQKNEPIDILHLHDWHSSLCAALTRDLFPQLKVQSIVLSLHSVEYQGKCNGSDLGAVGLAPSKYLVKEKFQDPSQPTLANLLKGGIAYSDAIVAVSPTYAKEILTPEFGFGLDPILREHETKISGILNGVDHLLWAPEKDPYLPLSYQKKDPLASILNAKEKMRELLKLKLNLGKGSRPWVGSICRLVKQKGPELIEAGLRETVQKGGTFFLLGSPPSLETQKHFNALKKEFENHPEVFIHFEFDEELAHQIYAALDFFLMPSIYEPCGLAQMIAMRYGTIPIARATGGLKDTVFDLEDLKTSPEKRNGFLFQKPTSPDLKKAMERAFTTFQKSPSQIESLIRNGMTRDFSWKIPSQEYFKLYQHLLSKRGTKSIA